jgi:hypothetical protein
MTNLPEHDEDDGLQEDLAQPEAPAPDAPDPVPDPEGDQEAAQ